MKRTCETEKGKTADGAFLRMTRPLPLEDGKYAGEWNRFCGKLFAAYRKKTGLTSLLVDAEEEVTEEGIVSLFLTETGYKNGERVHYRIEGVNYDLSRGVTVTPGSLGLQDSFRKLRKSAGKNPAASEAMRLTDGEAILYLCNFDRTRSARLRRSAYASDLQEMHFKLAESPGKRPKKEGAGEGK